MSQTRKNNKRLDFLLELGNIGTGHALTSLSKFIDRKVEMQTPSLKLLDYDDMVESLGGAEKVISGFLVNFSGDIDGIVLYLIQQDLASEVCDILLGDKLIDLTEMDEMETSLMKEIANIMTGSYATALSELAGIKVNVSVPSLAVDMAGAIVSVPLIQFENVSADVMFIQNKFSINSIDYGSSILLFLSDDSLGKLMKSFGVQ